MTDGVGTLQIDQEGNFMSEELAQHLIDHLLDAIDGELSSKSRVVDGLLDLRGASDARADVVSRVDELLVSMPGVNTVANSWWMATLEELRELIGSGSLTSY